MTAFISWYLILTLLGWLTFPLTHRLFPALADRGFTLSRAAGLLIWGYVFWLLASFGVAQNDSGGMLLALAILIGLSLWAFSQQKNEIVEFIKSNIRLILTTEILFLAAFGFMAFVRAANPELTSTEKPMELMFINGIMRSPVFPPRDPWLSGYAISYYYFGYVMTAMLAKLTGIYASMAHNLMTALVFGLGAVGSYGIVYDLLAASAKKKDSETESIEMVEEKRASVLSPLLGPLFLLLVSNFEALLEVLHRMGLFWQKDEAGNFSSVFWSWLDMKELSQPPIEPFGFAPERYLWWWRASRVVQDYDMLGSHREVIDEFPFFSFLLGDLHPHVLAIPFVLLAVAVALNIFLGGAKGGIKIFAARLHLRVEYFVFAALALGGLAFLNTWDILAAAALIVLSYVFWRAIEHGWNWDRLEDLFLLALPLAILSAVLYFPFYIGFSSQAGGLLPNLMFASRGAHLWVMWGTLLIPIFMYLIYALFSQRNANWRLGFIFTFGIVILLWAFSWALGWIASFAEKDFVLGFLASQNMNAVEFFNATTLRRLNHIGSLLTLMVILIPTISFLFAKNESQLEDNPPASDFQPSTFNFKPVTFAFLLLALGTLLILDPEFVYLRDQFGYRINTVFKFYYQAWILLSLVAAFSAAYLLNQLRGFADVVVRVVIGLVLFCGLLYPSLSLMTKTNNFKPIFGFTLDDFDRILRENPDEAAAINFLRTAPDGVVAEAVGDGYSAYGRISAYTGLYTVLGWPGHEAQWRGTYAPQGSRRDDISKLYSTARWEEAKEIIDHYQIRYIYIGNLERGSLTINEEKFQMHLSVVFQQGNAVIYEAP